MLVWTHRLFWLPLLALGWTLFAMNKPKSNVWAHYNHLLEPCFPLRSPSPTLGSIINNLRSYKYLELRIIKDKYKSTSFKGLNAQAHKLQKTSSQASKDKAHKPRSFEDKLYKFTNFKWSSPQASMVQSHKLQRQVHKVQRIKPKTSKDQAHKPTSFKSSSPQTSKTSSTSL